MNPYRFFYRSFISVNRLIAFLPIQFPRLNSSDKSSAQYFAVLHSIFICEKINLMRLIHSIRLNYILFSHNFHKCFWLEFSKKILYSNYEISIVYRYYKGEINDKKEEK